MTEKMPTGIAKPTLVKPEDPGGVDKVPVPFQYCVARPLFVGMKCVLSGPSVRMGVKPPEDVPCSPFNVAIEIPVMPPPVLPDPPIEKVKVPV